MIALVDALVRHTPPAVKAHLRRDGNHRKAGRPLLVAMRVYEGRHRQPTWVDEMDPARMAIAELERGE